MINEINKAIISTKLELKEHYLKDQKMINIINQLKPIKSHSDSQLQINIKAIYTIYTKLAKANKCKDQRPHLDINKTYRIGLTLGQFLYMLLQYQKAAPQISNSRIKPDKIPGWEIIEQEGTNNTSKLLPDIELTDSIIIGPNSPPPLNSTWEFIDKEDEAHPQLDESIDILSLKTGEIYDSTYQKKHPTLSMEDTLTESITGSIKLPNNITKSKGDLNKPQTLFLNKKLEEDYFSKDGKRNHRSPILQTIGQ
ncbi:hypothetical protein [Piscirickettsia litoralis]|uniref:Uncharacterized protein n=1 Tax=Piscirickettsia litoralis TaxID=1891921 RepID=A0ABX3A4Q2_9GAMM|nr:hypothetical protein [Piscirickettsia litoralis]ODN42415.1 hypothetical protein BGC07_05050 [Piscirickettsia litoralis]